MPHCLRWGGMASLLGGLGDRFPQHNRDLPSKAPPLAAGIFTIKTSDIISHYNLDLKETVMAVRYVVDLTDEERHKLKEIISKNKAGRYTIVNAYILLRSDIACGWIYEEVAKAYDVSTKKVEFARKRFVEEGLEAALSRKPVTNAHRRKMTGEEEAHLIALCCSQAPEGYEAWTLRILADTMVE